MVTLNDSFKDLSSEYQQAIKTAQDRLQIEIRPLQKLTGGWSGAVIYLVSAQEQESYQVQHLVMKLDQKNPKATSDEVTRHQVVLRKSPKDFVANHVPTFAYPEVQVGDTLLIFYSIAGGSLQQFRTLSTFQRQEQLKALFRKTNDLFLLKWNQDYDFEPYQHPRDLLQRWLGFRLDPGQRIEQFIREEQRLDPGTAGFMIQGVVYPNPIFYAHHPEAWGKVRPGDAISGFYHGDLNTNNILAKFEGDMDEPDGYYLIDFAMFKEDLPLFYDLRYLEISYLVHALRSIQLESIITLVSHLARDPLLENKGAPVETSGIMGVIRSARLAFKSWLELNHPTLQDDLWGQYWLAGTAAGLSYCHKSGQEDQVRLAGLIYATANLKMYFDFSNLPMPSQAIQIFPPLHEELLSLGDRAKLVGTMSQNLPTQMTPFIGRKKEIERLQALLKEPGVRIVTLTGPGGTGKTRLGLEVGRSFLADFPGGVYFVDLSAVEDPDLVTVTITHALGIREGGGRPPMENLLHSLAGREALILIDNFEQVIDAANILAELVGALPKLKILVTSRTTLRLRGEREYFVEPLSVPQKTDLSLESLSHYESVALFQQQARSARADFEITEENKADVIGICQQLDGLPLAIEIAAARVKMLPPKALLKRLDDRLKLLVSGARDLPDRQQTLTRTITWSYDLLEPEVQTLFSQLGIFAGGFTLQAAEGVCQSLGDADVFSGIEALLDNSLLRQVDAVTEEPRFNMLQTVRDFALMKAEEMGILEDLRQAHNAHFTQVATSVMMVGIWGADSVFWLKRMQEEHDNFRVALSWGLSDPERIQSSVMMMGPLIWFWFRYGHLREGSEWTEKAVEMTEGMGDTPARGLALVSRAALATWSGDLIRGEALAQKGVEINQRLKFDLGLSMGKLVYGVALINRGKDKAAYPHLVDAVELFDQQKQPWNKGTALVHLGNVSLGLGDLEQAEQWLEMAMPFMKESGDPWNMAFALNNFGEVARAAGNYEQAEAYYRQTEKYFEQADAVGDKARLIHNFGYLEMHKGALTKAENLFKESLEAFRKLGNPRGIAECLAGLAGVAVEREAYAWAAPLLGAADQQLKAFGGTWWPADRVEFDRAREKLGRELGEEFESLWVKGERMSAEGAIAYALNGT